MRFLAISRRCPGVTNEMVAAHAVTEAVQAFRLMSANVFALSRLCKDEFKAAP